MTAAFNHICLTLPRADFVLSVDLALPAQGITVLFGASGSGKTTLLRGVAGLERGPESSGLVEIAGERWQDDSAQVFWPTWRRPLGYVFQEASLLEHLDVQGNLQYGLKRTRNPQAAPALATQPRLLLLDEPLAALDAERRQDILPWLERLRDELHIPMLYVTHAIDELARLADHLVVLERGQVQAAGHVTEVMARTDGPALGGEEAGVLLHGQVVERDARWHLVRVAFDGGSLWLRDGPCALGQRVRLRVLARDVSLATQVPQHTSIQNPLRCRITAIVQDAHPSQVLVRLQCGSAVLLARITARAADALGLRPDQPVWAQVKAVALVQ